MIPIRTRQLLPPVASMHRNERTVGPWGDFASPMPIAGLKSPGGLSHSSRCVTASGRSARDGIESSASARRRAGARSVDWKRPTAGGDLAGPSRSRAVGLFPRFSRAARGGIRCPSHSIRRRGKMPREPSPKRRIEGLRDGGPRSGRGEHEAPEARQERQYEAPDAGEGRANWLEHEFTTAGARAERSGQAP
jgi:hypothetical protein